MTKINLKEAEFRPPIFRSDMYTSQVWYANQPISELIAFFYSDDDRHVLLDKIQTKPDYRRNGISRIQVLTLIDWSRSLSMSHIRGCIGASLLLEDNVTHVSKFFSDLGFSVNGNKFRIDF